VSSTRERERGRDGGVGGRVRGRDGERTLTFQFTDCLADLSKDLS